MTKCCTHDGIYKIKIGYKVLKEEYGIVGNYSEIPWNKIWKAVIPYKMRTLLWRIAQRAILVMTTLAYHGIAIDQVNFDGAIDRNNNCGGVGVVIRDEKGQCMGSYCSKVNGIVIHCALKPLLLLEHYSSQKIRVSMTSFWKGILAMLFMA
ncbi:hypothetical protein DITRI_Ditri04bG0067500 [Diplodiscus trichospermus]